MPAVTSGNYYTVLVGGNSAANNFMSILETSYNPTNFSSASQSPLTTSVTVGQPVVVSAVMAAALNSGEYAYLRYSTDGFSTSSIVAFSFSSGSTYTATIPGSANTSGTTVSYYLFTSNQSNAPATTQADYFSLNLYNSSGQNVINGGTNYSYTVNTPATVYLHNFNDISSNATPPYTTSPTATTGTPTGVFASNLSNSSWTNGTSSSFILAGGNSGNSLTVSAVSASTYTLTFSVASGYSLSVTSFNYWRQSSQSTNSVTSITINGTSITSGSVAVPTSGAFIGSTNVANNISGLTGTITVVINFGGGTGSFRLDEFTLNGNVVVTPSPPTLTTPTATVTLPTAATLGATVSSNGGSTLTARGTAYKTTASVAATDNQLAEGGTTVAAYTHSRTGLTAQTQYYYVGY